MWPTSILEEYRDPDTGDAVAGKLSESNAQEALPERLRASLLGPKDAGLLLRLPDEHDALIPGERREVLLAAIEKKHGKGKALSILAHKIGRAVFYMLSRGTVFSMDKFRAA